MKKTHRIFIHMVRARGRSSRRANYQVDLVDYLPMVGLIARAYVIVTDSGGIQGIQEEVTALDRPTLVLRDKTERLEGSEAEVAKLVATQTTRIVGETITLIREPEAAAIRQWSSR